MLSDPLIAKYVVVFILAIWGIMAVMAAGRGFLSMLLGIASFLGLAYVVLGTGFSIRLPSIHQKMEVIVYTTHNNRVHALAHPLGKPGEPIHIVFSVDPGVRIHGVRQFHAMASFLTYGLGMLRSDVALLNAPQLGIAEAISQLAPGDVVVVMSCSPYTRSIAEIADVSARHGLEVIAITDTRSSPLAASASHAFFVPHESSFFSNSMGAYIVFCEGLLNLAAKEMGDEAAQALTERERMIAEMKIEM